MSIVRGSASDSTYHSRHSRRTLSRAERIGEQITVPGTVLDVGCNNGITSQYLLDSGKASHVTGIELHASTLDELLSQNPSFSLIEGNVVDIDLEQSFDYVVYGAVHHHILNLNGLTTAIETLSKLVTHCNTSLFFETGQLSEGGRWEWQNSMRRHFRTDEEHFFYLLRSIEHMIDGFEVIGRFWIHGVRRYYLRIDMKSERPNPAKPGFEAASMREADGPYVRTRGSQAQQLLREEDAVDTDSPVRFWIATAGDGDKLFIKRHEHLPCAAEAEWKISRQLDKGWAVVPVSRSAEDGTLVFPYLSDALQISNFVSAPEQERRRLAYDVLDMIEDARRSEVELPVGILLSGRDRARLIDVVDLNANNFLVVRDRDINLVKVVDFEMQSLSYASRNSVHLAKILWTLRQRRMRALAEFLRGWTGILANLLRFQREPFEKRIVARQPNLVSLLVADFRTIAGRTLAGMLRLFGLH